MSRIKSPWSTLSVAAATLATMAACGGSNQSQANSPSSAQTMPTEQSGAAMGQPPSSNEPASPGAMSQQNQVNSPSMAGAGYGSQDYGAGANSQSNATSTGSNAAPSTMGSSAGSNSMSAGAGTSDVSSLSDGQLAAVVQTIHQGEMQQAQLAQTKASAADVKRFARDMLSAHREMMNKENAALSKAQIMPADSTVSTQLKTETQSEISTLQGLRGKDFDREYMDAQVRGHNKALELLDRILPNVKSAELKADLQTARPKIEDHLRHAEEVMQKLQTGMTSAQPDSHHGAGGGQQ